MTEATQDERRTRSDLFTRLTRISGAKAARGESTHAVDTLAAVVLRFDLTHDEPGRVLTPARPTNEITEA